MILEPVDVPMPTEGQPQICEDLQKALGDIERGAEERMEVLRGQKRALEIAAKKEKKTVLGHTEEAEEEEVTEIEKEEKQTSVVDPPRKRRTTKAETVLKEEQKKQFMADQERRWLEFTRGRYETRTKTKPSASLGAPVRSAAVTSTTTTTTATVSSLAEVTEEIDLEEAMVGKGDEEETGYEKRYKTTSEDRTDRSKARHKQREERSKNGKRWNLLNKKYRPRSPTDKNNYQNRHC